MIRMGLWGKLSYSYVGITGAQYLGFFQASILFDMESIRLKVQVLACGWSGLHCFSLLAIYGLEFGPCGFRDLVSGQAVISRVFGDHSSCTFLGKMQGSSYVTKP